MNKKLKILLLEDDTVLASSLLDLLEEENYDVTLVNDGEEVLEATYEEKYDLYLFDINVPLLNGKETLKLLRDAQDNTPTFFITALIDTKSTLEGFDCGCDDYIKKPFDPDELLARVKATLKRRNPTINYKNISFDLLENRVFQDEKEVALGSVEKDVFSLLIKNIGLTVNKTDFFDYMNKPSDTALRVLISKLKKTFDLNITNIKGIGYKLEEL
ncbi:response regulator transcription factor [Arcobacter roscoffensis]|uniref:Response regulator transcription factor n=1 Tax=Arcobacter roscoffensis TaxID=2961520 RepID=A0ABY5E6X9_9BACT|nr:response regulator transcription factor [Arcobacter roscoffensis]UTJ07500.1 response regulator transcription factor [Arcobacter roscoffensis]